MEYPARGNMHNRAAYENSDSSPSCFYVLLRATSITKATNNTPLPAIECIVLNLIVKNIARYCRCSSSPRALCARARVSVRAGKMLSISSNIHNRHYFPSLIYAFLQFSIVRPLRREKFQIRQILRTASTENTVETISATVFVRIVRTHVQGHYTGGTRTMDVLCRSILSRICLTLLSLKIISTAGIERSLCLSWKYRHVQRVISYFAVPISHRDFYIKLYLHKTSKSEIEIGKI